MGLELRWEWGGGCTEQWLGWEHIPGAQQHHSHPEGHTPAQVSAALGSCSDTHKSRCAQLAALAPFVCRLHREGLKGFMVSLKRVPQGRPSNRARSVRFQNSANFLGSHVKVSIITGGNMPEWTLLFYKFLSA